MSGARDRDYQDAIIEATKSYVFKPKYNLQQLLQHTIPATRNLTRIICKVKKQWEQHFA